MAEITGVAEPHKDGETIRDAAELLFDRIWREGSRRVPFDPQAYIGHCKNRREITGKICIDEAEKGYCKNEGGNISRPFGQKEEDEVRKFLKMAGGYFSQKIEEGVVSQEDVRDYLFLVLSQSAIPAYGCRWGSGTDGLLCDYQTDIKGKKEGSQTDFDQFVSYLRESWNRVPAGLKMEQDPWFLKFDAPKTKGKSTPIRVYVNPQPNRALDVLKAWQESVEERGGGRVEYKVWEARRVIPDDFIVAYLPADFLKDGSLLEMLKSFKGKLGQDWMGDLPKATTELMTGVGIAPELEDPKFLSRIINMGRTKNMGSWRTAIANMINPAYFLAMGRWRVDSDRSVGVKKLTEEYFRKFLVLSGVNPSTMMQNSESVNEAMIRLGELKR